MRKPKQTHGLTNLGTGPMKRGRVPHADDFAVDDFAHVMKEKLAQKRDEGRGGWENKEECSAEFLSQLLREHVDKGDPIDVANFCMMLHHRGERISFPQSTSTALIERLTKAMEPFAKAADKIEADYGKDIAGSQIQFPNLPMSVFREARSAIATVKADSREGESQ